MDVISISVATPWTDIKTCCCIEAGQASDASSLPVLSSELGQLFYHYLTEDVEDKEAAGAALNQRYTAQLLTNYAELRASEHWGTVLQCLGVLRKKLPTFNITICLPSPVVLNAAERAAFFGTLSGHNVKQLLTPEANGTYLLCVNPKATKELLVYWKSRSSDTIKMCRFEDTEKGRTSLGEHLSVLKPLNNAAMLRQSHSAFHRPDFYATATTNLATNFLSSQPIHSYILRPSSRPYIVTMSVKQAEAVKHYRIQPAPDGSGWLTGINGCQDAYRIHDSLDAAIAFLNAKAIPIKRAVSVQECEGSDALEGQIHPDASAAIIRHSEFKAHPKDYEYSAFTSPEAYWTHDGITELKLQACNLWGSHALQELLSHFPNISTLQLDSCTINFYAATLSLIIHKELPNLSAMTIHNANTISTFYTVAGIVYKHTPITAESAEMHDRVEIGEDGSELSRLSDRLTITYMDADD